jgi:hypothetical protein
LNKIAGCVLIFGSLLIYRIKWRLKWSVRKAIQNKIN